MTITNWVPDAIFYQIFPDRFANGNTKNDPANVQPWGSPPNQWAYQGGDFRGIIEHFDYLLDLGINAIYLNPIFHSTTNHRYHTIDYFNIDPFLGDLSVFKEFIDLAHKNNVKVIIDGVLNHCGRGFFAFSDLLENGEHSPYKNWFHVKGFPLNAFTKGKAKNYIGWWGIKDLPKFNTSNPEVRKYLFDATRYWLEQGVDGWRLDVPNEIDDDSFWEEYRELVDQINPDTYFVGEIWDVNPRWVNDTHFHGVMNYPLRDTIPDILADKLPFEELPQLQTKIESAYPERNQFALYNLLGSHDTRRALSLLEEDHRKLKLAFAAIFSYPGAPAIYYGDEIGLLGNKEPECRGAFPWNEDKWDTEIRDWVKKIIGIRKGSIPLRQGKLTPLFQDGSRKIYAFSRQINDQKLLVLMNFSDEELTIDFNADQAFNNFRYRQLDLISE